MKIIDLKATPISVKLKVAYGASKRGEVIKRDYFDAVIVKLVTDEGVVGYGEVAYAPRLLETLSTLVEKFEKLIFPLLSQEDPANICYLLNKIAHKYSSAENLLAGIDVALYDMLGKSLNSPIYKLLGGRPPGKSACASTLVPMLSPEDVGQLAERFLKNGIKMLKMKAGDDISIDVARVRAIREAAGDKVLLNVDVGESWITPKRALKHIRLLEKYGVDFVEQPVVAHDISGLKQVTQNTDVTIVADESVKPGYIMRLLAEKAVDMLALKLTGIGGISAGMRYAFLAEEAGIECSIGTYIAQTSILDAASLHLFYAMPNITVSELGRSVLYLEDDPMAGLKVDRGELVLEDDLAPGLGVKPKVETKHS